MNEIPSTRSTHRAVLCFILVFLCATATASARGPESTHSVRVGPGWNLLSLPASVSNGSRSFLFPSAVSVAYVYRGDGYTQQDTLQQSMGFWLKFDSSQTVFIEGGLIFEDTIEVHAGWNLIGCLSVPIAVDSVQTIPPGIITGRIFEYVPGAGHQLADTLHPGFGYWTKVSQAGRVVLSSGTGLPCPGIPTVPYAGTIYHTVRVGTQCWLRENLNVGTMINGSGAQTNNGIIEKYCYGNDTANCNTYSGLYQWNEAMQYLDTTQGARGICPPGWHIPTLTEFHTLSTVVGGDGNALKAIGQGIGNGAGTNMSGFSALLAGFRANDGEFYELSGGAAAWSSTQYNALTPYGLSLSSLNPVIVLDEGYEFDGFSVRCLNGEAPNLPPSAPSNPAPPDGSTEELHSVTLSWSCRDPEADSLTFDLYFGTSDPPDALVSSNQSDTTLSRDGLAGGITYYWRVIAKDNNSHSAIGPVWSFTTYGGGGTPCVGTPTVTYAGKVYNTVQIGRMCWLRENLDVGTMISGSGDQTNNGIIEKYCYNNDTANCRTYGALYQWNEAMQYDTVRGTQGICPPGWRFPSLEGIQALSAEVGGDGNALKAIGQGAGEGVGTNTIGFSALLAGGRFVDFGSLGSYAYLWSSTQSTLVQNARSAYLYCYNPIIGYSSSEMRYDGFSVRCLREHVSNVPPNRPERRTPDSAAMNVSIGPTLTWSCTDRDGDPLTFDVYFGTDTPPDSLVRNDQPGTSVKMRGLRGRTTYYWRVEAKDNTDSTIGPVWSFTTATMDVPCPGLPTVTYAGKVYNTVQIRGQCWLKENLDLGTMINGSGDQADNGIIEKYCYNNDTVNCSTYGGLYQWDEARQYGWSGRGICPTGWHLPTHAELLTLSGAVGGDGNTLKAIGQGTGDGAGTNTSGFAALLAGYRNEYRIFQDLGGSLHIWSSGVPDVEALIVYDHNWSIGIYSFAISNAGSVRCINDTTLNLPPSLPSSPTPPDGSTGQLRSLTLSWSCSDLNGDALTYDVYFGVTNPPDSVVSFNQSDRALTRSGLASGTTYYWRVLAKDTRDSTMGPVWSFTTVYLGFPCPGVPTVTYAGKVYTTVQIGSQCWLRENLDVGTMVVGSQNQTANDTIEKYCYNNDPANCNTYGGLYQWNEAMQYDSTQGARGICPPGWHVPSLAEVETLSVAVGSDGNALKEIGQGYGGGAGTNTSGFSALLAGYRLGTGSFDYLGRYAEIWSSTRADATTARNLFLYYLTPNVVLHGYNVNYGLSVRCLKD
jgi:uncharacterized protein (TIGR02145 family)